MRLFNMVLILKSEERERDEEGMFFVNTINNSMLTAHTYHHVQEVSSTSTSARVLL